MTDTITTATSPPAAVPAATVENYMAAIKSYETAARLELESTRRRLGLHAAIFAADRTSDVAADIVRWENEMYDGAQAIAEFADQLLAGGGGNPVQLHKLSEAAADLALQALKLADLKRMELTEK